MKPIRTLKVYKTGGTAKAILRRVRELFKRYPKRHIAGKQYADEQGHWPANNRDAVYVCALGAIGLFATKEAEVANGYSTNVTSEAVNLLAPACAALLGRGKSDYASPYTSSADIANLNNGPDGRKKIIKAINKALGEAA